MWKLQLWLALARDDFECVFLLLLCGLSVLSMYGVAPKYFFPTRVT
jgi:hypothetical protein